MLGFISIRGSECTKFITLVPRLFTFFPDIKKDHKEYFWSFSEICSVLVDKRILNLDRSKLVLFYLSSIIKKTCPTTSIGKNIKCIYTEIMSCAHYNKSCVRDNISRTRHIMPWHVHDTFCRAYTI